jgi:hypothetical protein
MNHQDLHQIEGLQFMPVKADKRPIVKKWQTSTDKHDLSNCEGVGLVCGRLSGSLEVIDVDEKYSLDGKLFENYKRLIHAIDENLLNKLCVQKTKGGGFHLLYRCSKIEGNQKLANRPTTEEERKQTYEETYRAELAKSTSDEKAKELAEKAKAADKVRVLLETRGEGGYVMCFPSKGYDFIFGDLQSIQVITPDERETLHNIARQFNEVFEQIDIPKNAQPKEYTKGLSPFEDYNRRGDVITLLQSHGWKIVSTKGKKTVFLRPGQTTSASSGNFDHEKNWFSVFTTSTDFKAETAYLPYAVFARLECKMDFSEASHKLYDMGYGDRHEQPKEKEKPPSTRIIQSRVNPDDEDYSFLATPDDYDNYLQQVIDGTLQQGLTTAMPSLDEYFLFKKGNMVSVNGIDNVGKTDVMWYLQLISAMYHGWKWFVYASENTLGGCMRRLIQYYWGKQLQGQFAMNKTEYKIAKDFIESHFLLIKQDEALYNYKDILNMVKKARRKYPDFVGAMIDPYNSLKMDISGFSKLSTHEYHYEGLSELKAYGQQNEFGWFINHHAYTAAARQKDGEKKYPKAPGKADTEGGQKVANKTDEFLTIHRITQHPTEWMITEIHVRKVKDTDTGGRPTSEDSPVKLEMYKGKTAFRERLEGGQIGVDPVREWHIKNGDIKQSDLFVPVINLPYKNDYLNDLDKDPF